MYGVIQTKVKTTVFAAKLRKRRDELKKARDEALIKYKSDFATWKKSLAKWIAANTEARIKNITSKEVICTTSHRYRNDGVACFDTSNFFRGAPDAPTYPDDRQIRDIQSMLRQLGISGVETIHLSTEYVDKYFADKCETSEEE